MSISVISADKGRTYAGVSDVYDYYRVEDTSVNVLYDVHYQNDSGLYWVRNQQTEQVLKQGGARHQSVVAAIEAYNAPEPEPEEPEVPEEE